MIGKEIYIPDQRNVLQKLIKLLILTLCGNLGTNLFSLLDHLLIVYNNYVIESTTS